MNAKHTPTPWEVDAGGTVGHIKSVAHREDGATPTVARYNTFAKYRDDGNRFSKVVMSEAEEKANAEFICRAVNGWDALVAACEAAAKHLENFLGRSALEHVDDRAIVRQLQAALALTEPNTGEG